MCVHFSAESGHVCVRDCAYARVSHAGQLGVCKCLACVRVFTCVLMCVSACVSSRLVFQVSIRVRVCACDLHAYAFLVICEGAPAFLSRIFPL